jgi:Ca2+/Na+ antiporter
MNWVSLSRDCGIYSVAVIILTAALWDSRIEWYEALALVLLYSFYVIGLYALHMQNFIGVCAF